MNWSNQVAMNVAIPLLFVAAISGCGKSAANQSPGTLYALNVSQPESELTLSLRSTEFAEESMSKTLPLGELIGPISLKSGRWHAAIMDQSPLPGDSVEYGIGKSDRYLLVLHGFNRNANLISPSENPELWKASFWTQARLALGGIDETTKQRLLLQQTLLRIPKIDQNDPPRLRVAAFGPDQPPIVATIRDRQDNEITTKQLSYPMKSDWLKPSEGELDIEIRYASSPVLIAKGKLNTPPGSVSTLLAIPSHGSTSTTAKVIVHQQVEDHSEIVSLGQQSS